MAGYRFHARVAPKKGNQLLLAHGAVEILGIETGVVLEEAVRQDLFDGGAGVLEEVVVQQDEAHGRGFFQHCPNWLPSSAERGPATE